MKKTLPILQFELSPLAKAGVLVQNLRNQDSAGEHPVSAPHRDAHYLLLLATRGRFVLHLDFEEVVIEEPALLLVAPAQVHHIRSIEEPQGWAIAFDPALLDEALRAGLENDWRGPVTLDPDSAFYQQATALAGVLEQLQADAPNAHTRRATQALLTALLALLAGQLAPAAAAAQTQQGRGVLIEQAFSQLLHQHYRAWKQPAQYAAQLAISVAHLHDSVKGATGLSPSARIQQRAVLEAKRLLYFTDLSVKEIGYATGYDEPVYFGKLFKKVTGLTPLRFRQQFRD
jgi:AraC family transcriptional regulator, transcriptional activator of pobA